VRPFVAAIAGPLIRVVSERFTPELKAAILETLGYTEEERGRERECVCVCVCMCVYVCVCREWMIIGRHILSVIRAAESA
jgi:hypothetical protein